MEKLYLQGVLVSKEVPYEEAYRKALDIMKKKKATHKMTKNYHEFRNIPKTRFKVGSFRMVKVNEDVILRLGHLDE